MPKQLKSLDIRSAYKGGLSDALQPLIKQLENFAIDFPTSPQELNWFQTALLPRLEQVTILDCLYTKKTNTWYTWAGLTSKVS